MLDIENNAFGIAFDLIAVFIVLEICEFINRLEWFERMMYVEAIYFLFFCLKFLFQSI